MDLFKSSLGVLFRSFRPDRKITKTTDLKKKFGSLLIVVLYVHGVPSSVVMHYMNIPFTP